MTNKKFNSSPKQDVNPDSIVSQNINKREITRISIQSNRGKKGKHYSVYLPLEQVDRKIRDNL